MLPVFESNGLLDLPQRGHWDVPIGALNVRLVHDELDMVTVFLTESSERSTERLDTVHASASNVISVNHGIWRKLAIGLVINET
jgi:hypothetical protein